MLLVTKAVADRSGLTPLDYITRVLDDPKFGDARRDKLAMAALKYIHDTPTHSVGATPSGKTAARAARAKDVGIGRLAPRQPPKLVVSNT